MEEHNHPPGIAYYTGCPACNPPKPPSLDQQMIKAINSKDYAEAARLINKQILKKE